MNISQYKVNLNAKWEESLETAMHRGLKYISYNETEYMIIGSGYYLNFDMSYDVFKGLLIYNIQEDIENPILVHKIELQETVFDVEYYI